MSRVTTQLAFVILELATESETFYVLHLNQNLAGYNWFGGHVGEGENPAQAVLRELAEETGEEELARRWSVKVSSGVPNVEWTAAERALEPIHGPHAGAFILPFFSARAHQQGEPAEKVARISLFRLVVNHKIFPRFVERLEFLKKCKVPFGDTETLRPLCQHLSGPELLQKAWGNPTNPFLRIAFKARAVTRGVSGHAPPYIVNVPELEYRAHLLLKERLGSALNLNGGDELDVRVVPAASCAARKCIESNTTLRIPVELRWTASQRVLRVEIPFPESGVFILRNDHGSCGSRWVWHPRLVAQPGLWPLNGRKGSFLRLSLLGGRHIDIAGEEKPASAEAVRKRAEQLIRKSRMPSLVLFPGSLAERGQGVNDLLDEFDERFPDRVLKDTGKSLECRRYLVTKLIGMFGALSHDLPWCDEQDLGYQRLFTFSAYIVERLTTELCERAWTQAEGEAFWEGLCDDGVALERALVPVSDLRQHGWLRSFEPNNGLDALGRLTSFQRYNATNKVVEMLPAHMRQNHPSMRGFICPVDSPESKKVGVTLHLARGVKADVFGRLVSAGDSGSDEDLGYAASVVPFFQHNDGARAMMGGKNLKQAVTISGQDMPAALTGCEEQVRKCLMPLVKAGVLDDTVAPGVDLLVAYMPWYGLNFEDGIVANRRLLDEHVFDWVRDEEGVQRILPGFDLMPDPPAGSAFQAVLKRYRYDQTGLRRLGAVDPATVLGYFRHPMTDEGIPVHCGGTGDGELVEIRYQKPPSQLLGGVLRWRVRRRSRLGVGDKLTGRHGNKGVVAAILAPEEMPRLPNVAGLPEAIRGRAVDLVLNPHGVISRMNLGQLLETQIGLAKRLPFGDRLQDISARAFVAANHEQLRGVFDTAAESLGSDIIDEAGRMYLHLPNGASTRRPVTAGYQQFVRLPHVAEQKAQARPVPSEGSHVPYSLTTGQPVGGRRRGGGQRFGEMEVWALAAHGAQANLASLLGAKSDPSQAAGRDWYGQTFRAIHDHLLAMGIVLQEDGTGFGFSWLEAGAIGQSGNRITSDGLWTAALQGRFFCRNENCSYRYPRPVYASGRAQRGGAPQLTVRDVLADRGCTLPKEIPGVLSASTDGQPTAQKLEITALSSGQSDGRNLTVRCSRKKKSVTVRMALGGDELVAYGQVKGDWPLGDLGDLRVSCPQHTSQHLQSEGERLNPRPVAGGVCDPDRVGGIDLSPTEDFPLGHIELPFPVPYPRDKETLRFRSGDKPPEISHVPVLPLRYRYGRPSFRAGEVVPTPDGLTAAYAKLAKLAASEKPWKAGIQRSLSTIFREIHGRLFGKFGLIRRAGLGRRVDGSARLVIVPDPSLDWDECGIPCRTLIVLMGPWIARWEALPQFVTDRWVERLIAALGGDPVREVSEEVRQVVRSEGFWTSWPQGEEYNNAETLDLAREVIDAYLVEHQFIRILLNRQPSLHRYSVMAFRPVPLGPEEGMVVKINPLVCKGFGADFDGDEISVHMPLSDREHEEADRLKPTASWNLVSVADGEALPGFDQDFVLGHFLLSLDPQRREDLVHRLAVAGCADCRAILDKPLPWGKEQGMSFLQHLCEAHPEQAVRRVPEWMRASFDAVTTEGISFGFLELASMRNALECDATGRVPKPGSLVTASQLEQTTETIGANTLEYLRSVEEEGRSAQSALGYGFAAMAVSGARGAKQARQLVAARGFLSPGDVGFSPTASRFFGESPLVSGMDVSTAFWLAMNTRSAMTDKKLGTPKAGDVTRRLVLAGWRWYVKEGDCGVTDSPRRVSACRWVQENTVCAACYGDIVGLGSAPNAYPAGLIAAQSFGERGTQLSMQSFHTGKRQLSMGDVVALLNGADPVEGGRNWFRNPSEIKEFLARIKREHAYARIYDRHLELIWLIIHQSARKTLDSAVRQAQTPLSALIAPGQWQALLRAIREDRRDHKDSPFTKTLLSQSPT